MSENAWRVSQHGLAANMKTLMKKQFISVMSEKAWRVSQHGLAANMKTLMKKQFISVMLHSLMLNSCR